MRNPTQWASLSAFAPICHPSLSPWGIKAFKGYLGKDPSQWAAYDATELLKAGSTHPSPILIDQGEEDKFLKEGQLLPEHFQKAAEEAGQSLQLRMHPGYDHSYWFIQSFIADHVAHHARYLL